MEEHFATLKLLDSDADCKLTRAFSYSELPSAHQICMKQFYSGNSASLVRQYSCEQIFDKTVNTRQYKVSEVVRTDNEEYRKEWQTTVPISDTSNWPICNNVIQAPKLIPNNKSNEIEYMEIDNVDYSKESRPLSSCLSTNADTIDKNKYLLCNESKNFEEIDSEKKQINVTNEKNKNTYEDIKKKLRPLVAKTKAPVKNKINMCCCNLVCLCILPVVLGIVALLLNPVTYTICNRVLLFSNATQELQQKLYGQANAISSITYALQEDIYYLKVICLIGGTGVGKSYTAEIIGKNSPLKSFVYDLTVEHSIDKRVLSSFDSYELLIIENLKIKNLDVFVSVLDALSKNTDKCVTVFAVFNIENVNDHLEREVDLIKSQNVIAEALTTKTINVYVVPYDTLSEEALEKCIMDVARSSNLILTQSQMDKIKQGLLLSGSGCKGAYAKVQVIGRE